MTFFVGFAGFNWLVDAYGVFTKVNPDQELRSFEPNTRLLKFQNYSKNCNNFDTVIFGTSRSAGYSVNADIFEKKSPYNFSVSAESYIGIKKKINWIIENKCPVKTIVLPISIDHLIAGTYKRDFTIPPLELLRMDSPELIEKDSYTREFLSAYLFSYEVTRRNLALVKKKYYSKETYNLQYRFRETLQKPPSFFKDNMPKLLLNMTRLL